MMLAAAAAAAWSTYLHWLPCRGAMLSASILHGYAYGPDFSDACLRRMDTGTPIPFPPEPAEVTSRAAELGIVATVLLGLATLVVVLGLRLQARLKALALLPGLATLVVAGVAISALRDPARNPDGYLSLWLWIANEAATVVVVVVLYRTAALVEPLRLVVLLWGTTATGLVHTMGEYAAMTLFSDANWDTPPGTGHLTVAVVVLAAVLTVIMTLSTRADRDPRGTSASAQTTERAVHT